MRLQGSELKVGLVPNAFPAGCWFKKSLWWSLQ